ncbi:transcription termination/antitermination protein NusG [Limimaricola pyoseonensis]|uniref:Transcriptional antiterminator RfaH n=1 Tax=Limimaricola pyoseonensis TaxID=521013 RepID=A0A1G7KKA1_9RHOB|nr:transcriptional activator RfaH [Limimaricola pyoseonensis]SDF37566.1 transcriptional antiterminator RfaH [Limimaricola pyoseonensis]
MDRHWYIAQLKPNGLRLARQNLGRQGFDVFCPLQELTRTLRNKPQRVQTPLFPGYFFVSLARGDWRAVNNTRGVSRLVALDEAGPRPVPGALIEALRDRCDEEGVIRPAAAPEAFEIGERVEVTHGPLAGFVSRVEALAPEQRIWVLLELMGRETRVMLRPEDLRRAG